MGGGGGGGRAIRPHSRSEEIQKSPVLIALNSTSGAGGNGNDILKGPFLFKCEQFQKTANAQFILFIS